MFTFSGVHITREFGSPTFRDIAVQLMRMPRWGGASPEFWPVGNHVQIVADMVRVSHPRLEAAALLHDATEVSGDITRPFKTPEQSVVEHSFYVRILEFFGIPVPTEEEYAVIKSADLRAVEAEAHHPLIGPRGIRNLSMNIPGDRTADWTLTNEYVKAYMAAGAGAAAIHSDSEWVRRFENRLISCICAELQYLGRAE